MVDDLKKQEGVGCVRGLRTGVTSRIRAPRPVSENSYRICSLSLVVVAVPGGFVS